MTRAHPFKMIFDEKHLIELHDQMKTKPGSTGRDGISPSAFGEKIASEIEIITKKVRAKNYKFTRYKEKLISKGYKKFPRLISIPTQRDRLTLRALFEFLSEAFPNVSTRKPHKYISEIRDCIRKEADTQLSFLRLDIKEYYPNIRHDLLLRSIRRKVRKSEALKLISDAIQTETIRGVRENGIPQGLSISNLLAAIYLDKFDIIVSRKWPYFRYVDDILVICQTGKEEKTFKWIERRLKKFGLECHAIDEKGQKTYYATVEKGVSYLGFHVSKDQISVRESSYKKMFDTLVAVLTANKENEKKLLWKLNLKITGCVLDGKRFGWMHFFSMTENASQLKRLDQFVQTQLKRRKLSHLSPYVKKFIRSHFEIRHDSGDNKYIPNFDTYSPDDMVNALQEMGIDTSRMTNDDVKTFFLKTVKKEASALDRDLLDPTS